MEQQQRKRLRVVLLGDFGVGKTSLFRQYFDHKFSETPSNTVNEDEREATVTLGTSDGKERVILVITDTAGQEQFRSFTSSYFRDKDGYVVVYDVHNVQSFENLGHWVQEIRAWDACSNILVVGNKIDVEAERAVGIEEAEAYVESLGKYASYLECSAKLNINCTKAFRQIAEQCHSPSLGSMTTTTSTIKLNTSSSESQEQSNFTCPCN